MDGNEENKPTQTVVKPLEEAENTDNSVSIHEKVRKALESTLTPEQLMAFESTMEQAKLAFSLELVRDKSVPVEETLRQMCEFSDRAYSSQVSMNLNPGSLMTGVNGATALMVPEASREYAGAAHKMQQSLEKRYGPPPQHANQT